MPEDLDLNGGPERFTITVTFDTLELSGKVVGSREVTVENKSPVNPTGK